MPYFDYSATTPCDPRVSKAMCDADANYYANPNASHALGRETRAFLDAKIELIQSKLGSIDREIIITGGASESNNLALKGYAALHPDKKHIISSLIEHSSVISPLNYLMTQGYDIDFVSLDDEGRFDLESLKNLLREDTLMVSLVAVDSETGIRQPVEEAAQIAHSAGVIFHCDATQALGKCAIDVNAFDLVSFSAHKFYGPKGVGGLIKRIDLDLLPMIHGGKSLSKLRSGTPAVSMVAALAKAVELFVPATGERIQRVTQIHDQIFNELRDISAITFNSNRHSIPQILNISVLGHDSDEMVDRLSEQGIFLTARSACTGREGFSKSVFQITQDEARATSSLRISLSHLTTDTEVAVLLKALKALAVSR